MPFPDAPSNFIAALDELAANRWENAIELLASLADVVKPRSDSPDWYLAAYLVLGVASVHADRHPEAIDYLTAILDDQLNEHPFWKIDVQETGWLPTVELYYLADVIEGRYRYAFFPFARPIAHDHRAETLRRLGEFANAAEDLVCVLESRPCAEAPPMLNYAIGLYYGYGQKFKAAVPPSRFSKTFTPI
jgi:tetratricopeptide (TPR) repeat protein